MSGMPPAHDPLLAAGPDGVTWGGLVAQITARARALADGDSVTVSAPTLARPAKVPGVFRRLVHSHYQDVAPWVRLERVEDHLVGRCVSDHKEIGFPLALEEKATLARLGWHQPGDRDGAALLRWFPDDVPSAAYLPKSDAEAAARLAVGTLREVFGVTDPAALSLS